MEVIAAFAGSLIGIGILAGVLILALALIIGGIIGLVAFLLRW